MQLPLKMTILILQGSAVTFSRRGGQFRKHVKFLQNSTAWAEKLHTKLTTITLQILSDFNFFSLGDSKVNLQYSRGCGVVFWPTLYIPKSIKIVRF